MRQSRTPAAGRGHPAPTGGAFQTRLRFQVSDLAHALPNRPAPRVVTDHTPALAPTLSECARPDADLVHDERQRGREAPVNSQLRER